MVSDLGNLPDNKIVSLAIHGVDPFMPENGACCGGYQGFLYPNPTTLVYPGFDPYEYQDPKGTVYTPTLQYTGLGVGNPGIDYKNPGHVLGILDTFCRMSYGIGMLTSIHAGVNGVGEPAVNISIPMMSLDGDTELTAFDIYPSLCEIPTDWVNSFFIFYHGGLYPSNPLNAHSPAINPIDESQFGRLFSNKSILSYYGMPQYLRSIISSMANAASPLGTKNTLTFDMDIPSYFNRYAQIPVGSIWSFPGLSSLDHHIWSQEGKVVHQCKTLSPEDALMVMTGSETYHDGSDDMNEYRSLTELNSVVNLVPLRTTGATYWVDDHDILDRFSEAIGHRVEVSEWSPRSFKAASRMASDLVLTVSDIPDDQLSPGEVTITGYVVIKNIIPETGVQLYHWHQTRRYPTQPIQDDDWQVDKEPNEMTWGPEERIYKYAKVSIKATNQYSWDRTWLGSGQTEDNDDFEDEYSGLTDGGMEGYEANELTPLPSDHELVVPFEKTLSLAPGCNSIKIKINALNRHWIRHSQEDTLTYMVHKDNWWPYQMYWYAWWAALLGYSPDMLVFPRRTIYTGYENDPDLVPETIEWSNIEAFFTITGDKFDAIECTVSL